MFRRRFAVALVAAFIAVPAAAETKPALGDEIFQPSVGQAGKDVIWVPTPDTLVTRMLTAAKVTKDDIVFDLGSGDGKIAIAAAKQFGAKADRKSTRLNSSHLVISYAVFCLKKKKVRE